MNERIRELADEARIKFSAHWAHQGVDTAVITRLDLKEFAELIVRECAQVCLAQRDPANLNYKPSERFAEAVKQHFGVEE
jgi:hypothetical protein